MTKNIQGLFFIPFLLACSTPQSTSLPLGEKIDLSRFMGDWYVIANIPTFIEKGAHNAIESYQLNQNGQVDTTFTFNEGAFDGELKKYRPTGFVSTENNRLWGMQFVWPFKAEYVISYVDQDYQTTLIARQNLDYLWIMARTPSISAKRYQQLIKMAEQLGYDTGQIKKVPQLPQKASFLSNPCCRTNLFRKANLIKTASNRLPTKQFDATPRRTISSIQTQPLQESV